MGKGHGACSIVEHRLGSHYCLCFVTGFVKQLSVFRGIAGALVQLTTCRLKTSSIT